jgi:hypothetical protein
VGDDDARRSREGRLLGGGERGVLGHAER